LTKEERGLNVKAEQSTSPPKRHSVVSFSGSVGDSMERQGCAGGSQL